MTPCRKFDGGGCDCALFVNPNACAMILFACGTLICVIGTSLIYAGINNNNFPIALGGIVLDILGSTAYIIYFCKRCFYDQEDLPIRVDLVPVARVINPVTELPPGVRIVPGIALV